MTVQEPQADQQHRHLIEVADQTLTFRSVEISDLTPTGAQLVRAADIRPISSAIVLHMLEDGTLEDVRPDETVDLRHTPARFIIVASDRTYRLTVEEQRFDWPCRVISGAQVRKIGRVPTHTELFLERAGDDRLVEDTDLVDLDEAGVESFRIRKREWKLKVQTVTITVETPTIVTRDAIVRAGMNPETPWHIFLKIVDQPKREIDLDFVIDLRTPGIEKVRLTAKDVNNGEAPVKPRRAFALLDADHALLDRMQLRWETVVCGERRWLLIHDYPVPAAFTVSKTRLALEIPPTYPGANIYGFYCYPPLALTSGVEIPSTQMRGTIDEVEFHGWSRRSSTAWDPARDNVATQLALVESALMTAAGE